MSLERLNPPALNAMAPVLNMIAEAYASSGKLSKAEATLRRSVKITELEHGAESEPMQVLFTNLAELLAKQRRSVEAHDARVRAARIQEAIEARARGPFMHEPVAAWVGLSWVPVPRTGIALFAWELV